MGEIGLGEKRAQGLDVPEPEVVVREVADDLAAGLLQGRVPVISPCAAPSGGRRSARGDRPGG